MPFKSHWCIVWKVGTVIVVLHNSFEALVYSLALLDFLFVFHCLQAVVLPSSVFWPCCCSCASCSGHHCLCGGGGVLLTNLGKLILPCSALLHPSSFSRHSSTASFYKPVLQFHDYESWQNQGGSYDISVNDSKQIGNFGIPSRFWSKIVWFGDPPEGKGLCNVSGQLWGY